MPKQVKVLIALLVAIGLSSIAYARFQSEILLPVVMKEAVYTLPTATPTPTPIPDIIINKIETGGDSSPDNYYEEYVRVKNRTSARVELTGWTIWSKRNNKLFTFPEFDLRSNEIVKVWTRPGTDTDTDLFWGLPGEVWKDDGDCAKLSDENEEKADWYYYPGDDCEW
jgi:hypothetical protein